jgi:hypothetical protein
LPDPADSSTASQGFESAVGVPRESGDREERVEEEAMARGPESLVLKAVFVMAAGAPRDGAGCHVIVSVMF